MEAIRIAYGLGDYHFGELRLPEGEGPHPVALIIHGGFWGAAYGLDLMDRMAEDFTARGLATWNIEYRRVGNEGGGWSGTLLDVGRATDHLRELAKEYPLDLGHVVVIGHSAGGHLALWVAGRHRLPQGRELAVESPLPVKAAVSLAGVNDLRLMSIARPGHEAVKLFLGGNADEVPERCAQANPAELLPLGVPQVLIHGTEDVNVPLMLSTEYLPAALAAGDDVQLVELPGVEHFKVIDPASEAWPPIVEAMMELTKKPSK
ncbi:MAG: alpha/beta hydrolase [Tumebacillaceae bacterium]